MNLKLHSRFSRFSQRHPRMFRVLRRELHSVSRVQLPIRVIWGFALYLPNSAHLRRRAAAVKPEQFGPQYPFVVGA
ncbi:hypothetical protein [Methylomonas fluvii]|uniref:hypothetical protein n=1 Tax=Methylomonas fluvii TaxID=1854564 RepID=UPI0018A6ECDB|nr:hypothetical protein [Methylomonas fluvii]CAD6875853.1 hypothetical protein [Methylomonas fluvii]